MKKPYLKKLCKAGKFNVWKVDGKYVRDNIDIGFTNFGQHYRFKFIPKNEFWIDKEYGDDESRFFIDHLLAERRLMEKGASYEKALDYADKIERRERAKSKLMKKKRWPEIKSRIHKKIYKQYKNLKVWIVRGDLVRSEFYTDFTEGGHGLVYGFIPENEIWLDDDLRKDEINFVLLHEMHERNLIKKGMKYPEAHDSADNLEHHCRHHPEKLQAKIKSEI